jgi:hypothetical protein
VSKRDIGALSARLARLSRKAFFSEEKKDFYSCASGKMPAMAWIVEAAEK